MRSLVLCCLAFAASACATPTNNFIKTDFAEPPDGARIVLMRPDVAMSLLTSGGLAEPRADWTTDAENHIVAALQEVVRDRGHAVVAYDPAVAPGRQDQLILLHEAVGASVAQYAPSAKVFVPAAVPTKAENFAWTLGGDAAELQTAYGADYALFITAQGSYASGGRVAAAMVSSVLFGGAAGAQMLGGRWTQASLVDLRSGDVIWMKFILDGDPREEDGAQALVERVTVDLPL